MVPKIYTELPYSITSRNYSPLLFCMHTILHCSFWIFSIPRPTPSLCEVVTLSHTLLRSPQGVPKESRGTPNIILINQGLFRESHYSPSGTDQGLRRDSAGTPVHYINLMWSKKTFVF